jgi:hypothetical protein
LTPRSDVYEISPQFAKKGKPRNAYASGEQSFSQAKKFATTTSSMQTIIRL